MLTEMKMLLVDGDEGIRKALALFFETRHCQLHTVENAIQGLTAIRKNPIRHNYLRTITTGYEWSDFFWES